MKKWKHYVLRKIAESLVIQGVYHQRNIIDFYQILIGAARKEFYEDNRITLDSFLKECHQKALDSINNTSLKSRSYRELEIDQSYVFNFKSAIIRYRTPENVWVSVDRASSSSKEGVLIDKSEKKRVFKGNNIIDYSISFLDSNAVEYKMGKSVVGKPEGMFEKIFGITSI